MKLQLSKNEFVYEQRTIRLTSMQYPALEAHIA